MFFMRLEVAASEVHGARPRGPLWRWASGDWGLAAWVWCRSRALECALLAVPVEVTALASSEHQEGSGQAHRPKHLSCGPLQHVWRATGLPEYDPIADEGAQLDA